MRLFGRLLAAVLMAAALSSCNTSDALTPRVDIGGEGVAASSPVTQADTDRIARSASTDNAALNENYGNRQAAYRTNPQNSLEAQARALEAGNASPSSSGPPPQWNGQTTGQQASGQNPPRAVRPRQAATSTRASAALPAGTIRFLPIIGAPVQAVTPLSRQLGAQARASGLTIRPSTDASTEHILKGYFSAFSDGGEVTVVYVWDILDGSGARLHRMQGKENVPARGSDPWAAVPATTMETIATNTIRDYIDWRRSQG